jgi:hypothetical protein
VGRPGAGSTPPPLSPQWDGEDVADAALAELSALSGRHALDGWDALERYVAARGEQAEPEYVAARAALERARAADWPGALHEAQALRALHHGYPAELGRVVAERAGTHWDHSTEVLIRRVRTYTAPPPGESLPPLTASEQQELEERLSSLELLARQLAAHGELNSERAARLRELQGDVPHLRQLTRIAELTEQARQALRGDDPARLNDLRAQIDDLPAADLPGYRELQQVGKEAREAYARYRRESGEALSIVRSEEILERVAKLEALARESRFIYKAGRDLPIEQELAEANRQLAQEAMARSSGAVRPPCRSGRANRIRHAGSSSRQRTYRSCGGTRPPSEKSRPNLPRSTGA